MNLQNLKKMLAAACNASETDSYAFTPDSRAAVLIETPGGLSPFEEVSKIELNETFAIIHRRDEQRFFVDAERIAGIQIRFPKREGAGFLP